MTDSTSEGGGNSSQSSRRGIRVCSALRSPIGMPARRTSTSITSSWSPFQLISTGEDQDLNGVDHVGGVGGAGVELAQDAPGLELSAGPLAGGAESGVGGIDAPLVAGQRQV